ncbi:MAG: hypothetical protein ACFFAS_12495 [Promethearchaeota archaeon]
MIGENQSRNHEYQRGKKNVNVNDFVPIGIIRPFLYVSNSNRFKISEKHDKKDHFENYCDEH